MTPEAYRLKVRDNPSWFLHSVLGCAPWAGQLRIIEAVRDNRRTSVAGCVASSKTMAAAMLTYWFLNAFNPAKVFTIAPTFRQVEINIWGEIRSLYHRAKFPVGGKLNITDLKLNTELYAMGMSTDDPNRIQGIHGENVLFILDEAQGIAPEICNAIENVMAGGNSKILMLMNPSCVSGEAFDSFHSKAMMYKQIRLSAWDTPNVKEQKVVVPGMITHEQVKEWIKVYGRDSNFVRVKVDAMFPKQESDTVIPIDWIEMAFTRDNVRAADNVTIGVDVARFGDDRTVIIPMAGRRMLPATVMHHQDTMSVAGNVLRIMKELRANKVFVDEIGIGAGVVDRLHELSANVHGVNVAEKPFDEERFQDKRSELWWNIRESLNPQNPAAIALPNDSELQAELSSVKYKIMSNGKIQIEPKDKMKERLGYSPDKADALALALSANLLRPAAALSQGNFFSPAPADWMG